MAREFFIYSPGLGAWVRQGGKTFACIMRAAVTRKLDGVFLEIERPDVRAKPDARVVVDVRAGRFVIVVDGTVRHTQPLRAGWMDEVCEWLESNGYGDEPVTYTWETK